MTWHVPVKETCPECGKTLFKRSGKGRSKPFCINEACPNFVPEDQRGYRKKQPAEDAAETAPAAKKTTTKSKKTATAKKNAAAKKAAEP